MAQLSHVNKKKGVVDWGPLGMLGLLRRKAVKTYFLIDQCNQSRRDFGPYKLLINVEVLVFDYYLYTKADD